MTPQTTHDCKHTAQHLATRNGFLHVVCSLCGKILNPRPVKVQS